MNENTPESVVPTLMIKNEETWIGHVLMPLVTVFPYVLVGDTGSEDRTISFANSFPHVEVVQYGTQTPAGLTRVRQDLHDRAVQRGAKTIFQVDGDELYTVRSLRHILAEWDPEAHDIGYVAMTSLDYDEDGHRVWELQDLFSRLCLMKPGERWIGEYPFEIPVSFGNPNSKSQYISNAPDMRFHAVHLHRFQRSPLDNRVYARTDKQFKFSMIECEVPRTCLFDLQAWLTS